MVRVGTLVLAIAVLLPCTGATLSSAQTREEQPAARARNDNSGSTPWVSAGASIVAALIAGTAALAVARVGRRTSRLAEETGQLTRRHARERADVETRHSEERGELAARQAEDAAALRETIATEDARRRDRMAAEQARMDDNVESILQDFERQQATHGQVFAGVDLAMDDLVLLSRRLDPKQRGDPPLCLDVLPGEASAPHLEALQLHDMKLGADIGTSIRAVIAQLAIYNDVRAGIGDDETSRDELWAYCSRLAKRCGELAGRMSEDHLQRHRGIGHLDDKAVRAKQELNQGRSQRLNELEAEDDAARAEGPRRREELVSQHRAQMREQRACHAAELERLNRAHADELAELLG
jgi:hypothetical protein